MTRAVFPNLTRSLGLPENPQAWFVADWPAPARVQTLITTRHGGVSRGGFAGLNVGDHVGDDAAAVAENRARVAQRLGLPPAYLQQVHGTTVVAAEAALAASVAGTPLAADASVDRSGRAACVVMSADCLPVLLCDRAGSVVAAAHAGWRGLAGGVLQRTVAAMASDPAQLLAYLGPAIGPEAFEVGQEVWDAFCLPRPAAQAAFADIGGGHYLANLYALARLLLAEAGVGAVYGGQYCTVLARDSFYSYRRDGQTGRMLSAVWLG